MEATEYEKKLLIWWDNNALAASQDKINVFENLTGAKVGTQSEDKISKKFDSRY